MAQGSKSRSLDEYAYAAMAMLDQVTVGAEDVTTVEIPSAWLREMHAWSRRMNRDPRREKKPGGRKPHWVRHLDERAGEGGP